jgi:hypothetical protein
MPATGDPNWFYSTLAASTAAMIGLTGGLLVTRVLALRDELIGVRLDLKTDFDRLAAAVELERQYAGIAARSARTLASVGECAGSEDSFNVGSDTVVAALTSRVGVPPAEWLGLETPVPLSFLNELRDLLTDIESYLKAIPASPTELLKHLSSPARWTSEPAPWLTQTDAAPAIVSFDYETLVRERRSAMRARWADLRQRSDALARPYNTFQARLIPRRFYFLVFVLGSLLASDIIVPMFFLSYNSPSVRIAVLAAFIPLSAALVGYFAFEIRTLRGAADLTRASVP